MLLLILQTKKFGWGYWLILKFLLVLGIIFWPLLLKERPDLLVSTPGRLLRVLEKCNGFCAEVRCVVLDEADLLLSYGYEEEMKWFLLLVL